MKLKNKFKIRCSAIGHIMTEPRSKGAGTLSKTCLNYVKTWIKEQEEFYNRSHDFSNKYTKKGNSCEAESIEFAASYLGWGLVQKNTERRHNEYIMGECDVVLANSVEDIKNSWSDKTFPLFEDEIPIDGYGWQLQGYCELWDKPQGGLVYTLMDAPTYLVEKEARYQQYELGLDELEADLYDEVKAKMTYSHLPDKLRIKRFFVDRDKSAMDNVYERVEQIRHWIENK